MRITADSYFCIGTYHQSRGLPCQDYAYSGVTKDDIHYAIVSDGCSDSRDSDLGSRYLTHWFREFLEKSPRTFPADMSKLNDEDKQDVVDSFKFHFSNMDLPHSRCLDATLLAAFYHPSYDQGYIIVAGDGAFAIKHKDQSLDSYMVHVTNSMPPYLSYNLKKGEKEQYTERSDDTENNVALMRYDYKEDKIVHEGLWKGSYILNNLPMIFNFDHKNADVVSVFTDGVASFVLPFGDPMEHLMDVKTPDGVFVVRTCLGNLKRLAKQNITHYDDLSMAALKFHHEEDSSQTE